MSRLIDQLEELKRGADAASAGNRLSSGLDAKTTRAIDFNEGNHVDESALKDLLRDAVAYNMSGGNKK